MNIFMTGGAGFLGRAILRDFRDNGPDARFTIFSRDEAKHARVRREFPEHRYILGDVTNYDHVELAMVGHDQVIHAAAMKYVPECETNPGAAININLDGSRNVALAAIRTRVDRVVGISTDKACEPANVYGMTKQLMERVFQEMAETSDTAFITVRYGNVIGSTGSVIPMFRQQAREGLITLTDPGMTRFWLTVNEAVELVKLALGIVKPYPPSGTVVVPQLKAAEMRDLVTAVAEIESIEPHVDIIGRRPGEKFHEMLLSEAEAANALSLAAIEGERTEQDIFTIFPHWLPLPGSVLRPYTSNNPVAFLPVSELVSMIQSASEDS